MRTPSPFRPRIAAATLVLAALAAAPAPAGSDCTARRMALLEGTESVEIGGMVVTYIQQFTLRKDSGAGTDGRWTGTEWDYTTIMPIPFSPEGLAAMSSVPTQMVPGVRASCDTSLAGPRSVRILCTGAYPFEVKSGVIRWVGRPEQIGTIVAGKNGGAPVMRLSMFPKTPYYSGVVTGTVGPAGGLNFKPVVTNNGYSAAGPYSEIQVNISVAPVTDQAAISLDASVRYSGSGTAPFWAKNTARNDVRLNARLHGDLDTRLALAGDTTITATATVQGCSNSASWTLAELALKDGVSP